MLKEQQLFYPFIFSCETPGELFLTLTNNFQNLNGNPFTPQSPKELKFLYDRVFSSYNTRYKLRENYAAVSDFIVYFTRFLKEDLPPSFYAESFTFLKEKLFSFIERDKTLIFKDDDSLKLAFAGLLELISLNKDPSETKHLYEQLSDYPRFIALAIEENMNTFLRFGQLEKFDYYERHILHCPLKTGNSVAILNPHSYLSNFLYATGLSKSHGTPKDNDIWLQKLSHYYHLKPPTQNTYPLLEVFYRANIYNFPPDFFNSVLLSNTYNFLPGLFTNSSSLSNNDADATSLFDTTLRNFDILYAQHLKSGFNEKMGTNLLSFIYLNLSESQNGSFETQLLLPICQKLLEQGEILFWPRLSKTQFNNLAEASSLLTTFYFSNSIEQDGTLELSRVYKLIEKTPSHTQMISLIDTYQEKKQISSLIIDKTEVKETARPKFKV